MQGFDLTDKTEVFHVPIPGAGQIYGITTDTSGNLYVIDGSYRRIYKINISTKTYTTFVNSGLPPYPQDCIFDEENNRLLVVAWASNAPIQAVSLSDSTVTNVVSTNFGLFDVITKDNVTMEINALLYYQITDPKRAIYEVANLPQAIEKLTQTTLRNIIGNLDLDARCEFLCS